MKDTLIVKCNVLGNPVSAEANFSTHSSGGYAKPTNARLALETGLLKKELYHWRLMETEETSTLLYSKDLSGLTFDKELLEALRAQEIVIQKEITKVIDNIEDEVWILSVLLKSPTITGVIRNVADTLYKERIRELNLNHANIVSSLEKDIDNLHKTLSTLQNRVDAASRTSDSPQC